MIRDYSVLKKVDPVAKEFLKYGSDCIRTIELLSQTIRKEYLLNRIDIYSYENQINLLSVMKLQLEHIEKVSRESINFTVGVLVDAKV